MSTYPPPGASGAGRRIEEAVELIEMEIRHAVAYVNEAIVPQARAESVTALRNLSDTLRNLADKLDQKGPRA
jgi:2-keto-3-deoxy-L-rhamnonate aldolase RhmA